ncbi:MAG: hypothetical protein ACRD2F_00065 [Terriglobales bacterium]
MLTKQERAEYAAWLGKRSYRARLERLGLARLQRIARENGKLGGRPPKAARKGQRNG